MGHFKAVIFDLDDTLYPERQFVSGGFAAAARLVASESGLPAERCARELECLFDRGERTHTFDVWLDAASLPQTLSSAMIQAYRQHWPSLTLHGDVEHAITWCRHARLSTGLVSDGYLDVQRRKVASLRLSEILTTIVLSDEFGRAFWKPSTRPYLAAVERLRVDPGEAVYVGDNPQKDFRGARRAGLKSVRIRRPGGVYASEEPADREAEPDCEVESLVDLQEALAAL
jgi:putative hydrolase of the HAD superfamily